MRRAVALREPDFAAALLSGGAPAFETEVRHVFLMMVVDDYSFLDHPSGRFALPGRVYVQVMNDREKLKGLLPARLVGAPPAAGSSVLRATTKLASVLVLLGLIFLVWGRHSKPAPAGPDMGKINLDG